MRRGTTTGSGTSRRTTQFGSSRPKTATVLEEWASIQCAQVGLRRVREATVTRLGTGEFNSAIGDSPGFFSSDSSVVRLDVATYLQANGTDTTPTTSLSRLIRDAPRSVDAAVSLEDETFSRTIPVFAEHLRIEAR
jgi:hypothetical protein